MTQYNKTKNEPPSYDNYELYSLNCGSRTRLRIDLAEDGKVETASKTEPLTDPVTLLRGTRFSTLCVVQK